MLIRYILVFFVLLTGHSLAAQQFTLSGTVSDLDNGETLIGCTVFALDLGVGTTTNEYGFYSLTLPVSADSVLLEFSYVGFAAEQRKVSGRADMSLNVALGTGVQLGEVVVKADSYREQLNSTQMSVETLTPREAKLLPVLFGESDILKTIQLKPGIPSGSEGTTGIFVRGGGADQNLIVLDEAVVYNASHLFGFFSTFNTDAVKDLKLYKGGFPAQYGGRLSSVIDVKLKEGNAKKFSGTGGLGLISSRLTLEGPLVEDKSSFMVSGRRTYFDIITRGINQANSDNEGFTQIPDYYFYDLNAKVNYDLGEKDRLFLSGYFGRDVFGFNSDLFNFGFNWGNATGTLRWNHIFRPKLFANFTATFSDYQYNISNTLPGFRFDIGSSIRDVNIKSDFYYAPNNAHTIRFGANLTYHQFGVGRLSANSDNGDISFSAGSDFDALEGALYIGDDWIVNSELTISSGLRFSGFQNDGALYGGIEPRVAAKYSLSDRMTLKASYARMIQYLHLIATAGASLPTDVWYPSTEDVAPQGSHQVAAGFSYLLGNSFFITNEYYYKRLSNQLEFVDGAELFANDDLEREFAIGRGYAYGGELGIEKREGKLTGWIGYTLAWIRRGEFETLSPDRRFGEGLGYFAPRYDRRHDISIVAIYELSRRVILSATWVYGSGDLFWLPNGRFAFQDVQGSQLQPVVPVYQGRNNVRLAAYHRLDLGLVIKFFPKWGESDLSFNVINAYDRRNAFFVFFEPEFPSGTGGGNLPVEVPTRIAAKQVSLFPILPSIAWNFKF